MARVKGKVGRTTPTLRVAEFFAGIGLVRLGLEARGFRVVFANDLSAEKREQYVAHFGDEGHFRLGDIHKVEAGEVPDVELATASFPCTDLSLAGGRAGLDRGAQSSAFWGFVRVLEEMGGRRPAMVMLENVTGFLSSHGGADFRSAMLALNGLGYSVDAVMLDARWFVPQSRPRLFIVGSRVADETAEARPELSRIRPRALCEFVAGHPEIRWGFRRLPEPPARSEERLEDVLEELPESAPEWWSRARREYLFGQFSEKHRAMAEGLMGKRRWSYGTVFRRVRLQEDGVKRSMGELRMDGVAGCLRTPKGGSARQILFKMGYGRYAARLLTARECARLMGAGEFRLEHGETRALFGFGDAVCVPAVSWIAEHYLGPVLAGV